MRIAILGKYPPIEGGVSARTYWLAYGLALRGHEVHVVTNAADVEETYRIRFSDDDWRWYQPEFTASGGRVRVYDAQRLSRRAMDHIPFANPFVSKLASIATDVVRRHECQVILAYYFEPYAVSGWLASRWTGVPLLVKHAGSDLDRLFRVGDLATTYKEILRSAEAVVTQTRLMPRFIGMGVDVGRLRTDIPYAIPPVFSPDAKALQVTGAAFDPAVPSIGVYGKIGISKGTFDLIAALGRLAREGIAFNFLAMIGEAQRRIVTSALQEAGLEDRTTILPLLANWNVPSFIRACTAVCFLERDFPVAIHGPIVPREVFACGTCLVVSDEIAAKQRFADHLQSGVNVLIVKDPKDHEELSAVLRRVIDSPATASEIGTQGRQISMETEDYDASLLAAEKLFEEFTQGVRLSAAPPSTFEDVELILPELLSYLKDKQSAYIYEEFKESRPPTVPFATAVAFCEFARDRVRQELIGEEYPRLLNLLRYVRLRLLSTWDPPDNRVPTFAVVDCLNGAPLSSESISQMRPIRGNWMWIAEFSYDVSRAFAEEPSTLRDCDPDVMLVLFHRTANSMTRETRIDENTRELLRLCDGTRTTQSIAQTVASRFEAGTLEEEDEVTARVVTALGRLYGLGLIVFGAWSPDWGWAGSERGMVMPLDESDAEDSETTESMKVTL